METPAAVVSLSTVRRNTRKVAAYCRDQGLAWRPHVKTHKCVEIARLQIEAGAVGLTVATPREAEVMATVSDDLLLAHTPVGESKLDRIVEVAEKVRLRVALDSPEALDNLSRAAARARVTIGVLIEVDLGMKRVGVGTSAECVELARIVSMSHGVNFDGILFYPGHIRTQPDAVSEALLVVTANLDRYVQSLDRAGLHPEIVSGGSTPTLWSSHVITGMTEMRAGTCVFNDRDMVALGHCGWTDCAYVVRASVISRAVPGQVVVDAGSKALSKEEFRAGGEGFGVLVGHPEHRVSRMSEEHGIIHLTDDGWMPEIGDTVDIIPNHVCLSVNLQDALWVEDQGRLERWALAARGRARWPE